MTPSTPKVIPPPPLPPPPPPPPENDDDEREIARQRADLERRRAGRGSLVIPRTRPATGLGVPGGQPGLRI